MSDGRWERLKLLFAEARGLVGEERTALLDRECRGDDELRTELESLLDADRDAGGFLEAPALDGLARELLAPESTPVGRRFGAYRVVDEIGRGGMGVVYRAVRDDDAFHREVALKVLPSELVPEAFEARFRRERQILATLDHPNIAHLLDGGADENGRPYFVLELVDGQPIDLYCRDRGLDVDARIELIRTACGAVALAHSRLVVHFDLKPGNVLVAADGTLKLLDFGIAKLLAAEPSGPMSAAPATSRFMTPEYASPEQVHGEPVTTATDVYALGVMLYELLTGRKPYRVSPGAPDEMARAICEQPVTRPSQIVARPLPTAASGAAPETSVAGPPDGSRRRLRRRLEGDLDTIVLRAMAKEPGRRYQTVGQLSEDLRRHLAGLPILARPDRIGYRAAKFIRRHRTSVAAGVMVVASLCGGLVATVRQARIADAERTLAERRFDEVRSLAGTFIFEIDDRVAALPGSTPVRKRIVELGLEYLERLEQDAAQDPALLAEIGAAYERIAAIQGGIGVPNLGDLAAATASQQRALDLRRAVALADPSNLAAQLAFGRAHSRLGDLLGAGGDRDGRRRHYDEALAIRRAAAARFPGDPAVQRALASSLWDSGQLAVDDGELDVGLARFEEVLTYYRALGEAPTASDTDHRNLALAAKKVGAVRSATGDNEGALESLEQALAIDQARLAVSPDHPEVLLDLSFDHGDLGYALLQLGRARDAADHYQRAVALRTTVATADPADARAHIALRNGQLRLAAALAAVIRSDGPSCPELRTLAERALELWAEAEAGGELEATAVDDRDRVRAALAGCSGNSTRG